MITSLPIYGDKIRITDLVECAVIDCNTTFTCVPSKVLAKGKWLALAWNRDGFTGGAHPPPPQPRPEGVQGGAIFYDKAKKTK